jgi:hypothetical protein
MAQSENASSIYSNDNSGFGFYQHVNFGKYKGTENANVYRIANLGDFKYLLWMLRPNRSKDDEGGKEPFRIHPTVIPHVKAALRIQGEKSKWVEHLAPDTKDSTSWIMQYVTDDGKLEGPKIVYRVCGVCGKRKNFSIVSQKGKKLICSKCVRDIFD